MKRAAVFFAGTELGGAALAVVIVLAAAWVDEHAEHEAVAQW